MPKILPYVLAVDPGVASGVALIAREGPSVLWSGELDQEQTCRRVDQLAAFYAPHGVALVAERFIITSETARKTFQPASLEIIGAMRWIAWQHGVGPLWTYSPADAKGLFDNDTLRRLDCYHRGGAGHAKDAIRHGLLHLVHTHWSDERMLSPVDGIT